MNYYYRSIPSEEMSDFQRVYEKFVEMLPDESTIVELGVADGRSVIMLASLMKEAGKRCKIWAVDNFSYGGDHQRNTVMKNIVNSGETTIEIMDMSSLDASCRAQDNQFNMVFIDSWHTYEGTKAELRLWIHKVMNTGIVAGHDYLGIADVKKAVDELVPAEHLHIENTTYAHGVFWFIKSDEVKLLK